MNYLEARATLKRLREFRRLALEAWALTPVPLEGRLADELPAIGAFLNGLPAQEVVDRRRESHRRLQELTPTIRSDATKLGVSLERWVAPAVGDPINHFDVFEDGLLEHPDAALNVIDRSIGAADATRHAALLRLVVPIYWLVDIPVLAVRWPWLILEKAGLPADIERNLASNVLKVLLFLAYGLVAVYLVGSKVSPDIIRALIPK